MAKQPIAFKYFFIYSVVLVIQNKYRVFISGFKENKEKFQDNKFPNSINVSNRIKQTTYH